MTLSQRLECLSAAEKPFKFETISPIAGGLHDYVCKSYFSASQSSVLEKTSTWGAPRCLAGQEVKESTCLLWCRPCGALHEQVEIPAVLGTGKAGPGDCMVSGVHLGLSCQL